MHILAPRKRKSPLLTRDEPLDPIATAKATSGRGALPVDRPQPAPLSAKITTHPLLFGLLGFAAGSSSSHWSPVTTGQGETGRQADWQ
jgi:hypothetical protein